MLLSRCAQRRRPLILAASRVVLILSVCTLGACSSQTQPPSNCGANGVSVEFHGQTYDLLSCAANITSPPRHLLLKPGEKATLRGPLLDGVTISSTDTAAQVEDHVLVGSRMGEAQTYLSGDAYMSPVRTDHQSVLSC